MGVPHTLKIFSSKYPKFIYQKIRLDELSKCLYSTEAWKYKNKKLPRVQRPHPIHFDGRKVTYDTFSHEHSHIVPQMKGLIELSVILYWHKAWKSICLELWPDLCTHIHAKSTKSLYIIKAWPCMDSNERAWRAYHDSPHENTLTCTHSNRDPFQSFVIAE